MPECRAVDTPPTRYVRSGDVHIAYQVVDTGGPITIVGLPPIVSNIEVGWENPYVARSIRRLAQLGRFVHFDKRGQGMSDRDPGVPTIDQRVEDLAAVMDTVGVERAVLAGISEGGSTAAMFAATHPERVSHLLLYGVFAALHENAGYPPGTTPATVEMYFRHWAANWATPDSLTVRRVCPIGIELGQVSVDWVNRYERQSTSPGALLAAARWIGGMDISGLLGAIRVPTLVVHSTSDALVPMSAGRYVADLIPGATFRTVDGADHLPWFGNQDAPLTLFEEFVTGGRHQAGADRVLATVLFTDIVDSTASAAAMGDQAWRALLDDHDHVVRAEVESFGGRVVKSTGDGSLATFDRPGRALEAALAIRDGVRPFGVAIRAGVHTGEIERRDGDVAGIAVHLAARVCSAAGPGEVLVSRTVTELVAGSNHEFSERGDHELKGIPGRWSLYAVET
jgi:class 3 adenylate cyclase/pimeloyl-ACP methyl ester carboxylesterase